MYIKIPKFCNEIILMDNGCLIAPSDMDFKCRINRLVVDSNSLLSVVDKDIFYLIKHSNTALQKIIHNK